MVRALLMGCGVALFLWARLGRPDLSPVVGPAIDRGQALAGTALAQLQAALPTQPPPTLNGTPVPVPVTMVPGFVPPPPPSAAPAMSDAGPVGCPVMPASGRVVMTQGYGVGSHAPAAIWGAVDLVVDGDGDGVAEPGASWDAPIVATHDGTVTATPNSNPAGNHVWVTSPDGVWKTGYSHLSQILVSTGQTVRAGEQIGLLGSTGMSSGPHLDYQVWRGGTNVDPTGLVDPCFL